MRVLLDECVDRRFADELPGHEVETVTGLGWAGVHNGDLLARATGRFDAFVTVDRNLAFQQPIEKLALAVVIRRTRLLQPEPLDRLHVERVCLAVACVCADLVR